MQLVDERCDAVHRNQTKMDVQNGSARRWAHQELFELRQMRYYQLNDTLSGGAFVTHVGLRVCDHGGELEQRKFLRSVSCGMAKQPKELGEVRVEGLAVFRVDLRKDANERVIS